MTLYQVPYEASASIYIVVEADSEKEAQIKANEEVSNVGLCNQCAGNSEDAGDISIDLGDPDPNGNPEELEEIVSLPYLVWIDIETTGLDVKFDALIELGLRITDYEGETIDKFSSVVSELSYMGAIELQSQFVRNMHDKNGLHKEVAAKRGNPDFSRYSVQDKAIQFLADNMINMTKEPMTGSSVHFDRRMLERHMPKLAEFFHYRNIDVSSVKELCKRLNPRVFEHLPVSTTDHRVQNCLDGSIAEYRHYTDNFLYVEY